MKIDRIIATILCTIITIYYLYVVLTKPLDFWPDIFNLIK